MPSNPLTQEEINDYALRRILSPSGYTGLSPYMPQGYFLSTPALGDGPALWRLFDASFISSGTIDPNRLGSGSLGAGSLYLADDGTWKTISVGGGGDMLRATYDVDNDGVVDSAETIQIIVRNSTGVTLTKGQVVYLSGATGNRPNAVLSQAHTEATSSKTIGIVVANINNNSDGYVAVNGTLHDLNTSAFTAGDAVWLSAATAGAFTSTIPAEPNHTVFIGYIARAHPTQGRIVLHIQNGYELNELHGVQISSEANNDLLVYETSSTLWKNKSISTIFGGTPLVSVPTLDQVTTAGNTTTNAITVGGATVNTTVNSGGIILQQNGTNIGEFRRVGNNNRGALYLINSGTTEILLETGGFSYIRSNGFGIGTATDAGYKLDVNGTARIQNDLIAFNRFHIQNGIWADYGTGLFGRKILSNESVGGLYSVNFRLPHDTGKFFFQSWNTNSTIFDIGMSAATLLIGTLITKSSITAATALAQGVYFNNTLVAAANNDVLVGLDINPTFTNGAFTGVSNYALRVTGRQLFKATVDGFESIKMQNFADTYFNTISFYKSNGTSQTVVLGDNGASVAYPFMTGMVANYGFVGNKNSGFHIFAGSNITQTFYTNGNVSIGTTTDAGYKLDINGTARVQGKLTVSTGGLEITGTSLWNSILSTNASTAFFNSSFFNSRDNFYGGGNTNLTSGYVYVFQAERQFQPASGTATYVSFYANPLINQTGGANGITRGLYINPTLTAAADFRAIETTLGNVLLATTSGLVGIGTTTPASKLDVVGDVNVSGVFRVGGVVGWTGTITIITNPPGQQNIQVSGGIITNVT
jgi:hypothetical protein